MKRSRLPLAGAICLSLIATACGSSEKSRRPPGAGKVQQHDADFNPEEPYVLRATYSVSMGGGEGTDTASADMQGVQGYATGTQAINATVDAAVKFTLSGAAFVQPATPGAGEESYGTLDVTDLRDNKLNVCGANGNQQCTVGVIRIFTQGTPGAGLWNTERGYGLPIKTGANVIGLDAAGAVGVSKATIASNTKVLHLKDFTGSNANVLIPVTVDFTDAAAGSYASTLVVEYLLQ